MAASVLCEKEWKEVSIQPLTTKTGWTSPQQASSHGYSKRFLKSLKLSTKQESGGAIHHCLTYYKELLLVGGVNLPLPAWYRMERGNEEEVGHRG